MPIQVEGEDMALEIREDAGQAGDQALEFLARNHLVCRIPHSGAGQDLLERGLRLGARRGRRLTERDVLVERGVLVARRGLDRGDDLAGDAELRETAEARFALGAIVA